MRFFTAAAAAGGLAGAILAGPVLAGPVLAGPVLAGPVLADPVLAAAPRISVRPDPSAPGTATRFQVLCGSSATSATLFGTALGLSEHIHMRQAPTATVGNFAVTVMLPVSIAPGTYRPSIDCSNGFSGFATLRVNPVPGAGALTGDGTTSTQTGTPLSALGFGAIALGVVAGALALFRRRPLDGG